MNSDPRPAATGWRALWDAFRRPALPGVVEAVERARARLPEAARTDVQALGASTAGCSATYGLHEGCDLACTACYLSDDAQGSPPLPLDAVEAQLRLVREHVGPWGHVQITSGEVTLLPEEHLLAVLALCRRLELTPMLMTNGRRLLRRPALLDRLLGEGGLPALAVHVDATQRGERGWQPGGSEAALHPLRERFVALIDGAAARAGRRPLAAHTVTITPQTVGEVPELVRWVQRHAGTFRMLSLQPAAAVGRTEDDVPGAGLSATSRDTPAATPSAAPSADAMWRAILDGLDGPAPARDGWHLGHPACNLVVAGLVLRAGAQLHFEPLVREGVPRDRAVVGRLQRGPFAGWSWHGERRTVRVARLLGRLARRPDTLFEAALFAVRRLWGARRILGSALGAVLRGRPVSAQPLTVVVHRFMDAGELATPLGQERLAACTLQVPVDGRMVSMCELNASGMRGALDRERTAAARAGSTPPPSREIVPA